MCEHSNVSFQAALSCFYSFSLIFIKERYHIRKFKRYIDDHRVSVPKSTKLDRSNTAISMTQSVISTELIKQWCQQRRVRPIKEKHLFKRQKQLYAITEVRWNSGPQMVMHCPKCKTILLIADRQRRTTSKL